MKHSVLLGSAFLAVAAFAEVSVDYNHHTDFSQIHTYSWIGVRSGNSLWQDRIMHAVDAQLAAKGWQRVESGGDAAVSAIGRVTEQESLQTFYDSFPGWRWGGFGESTTTAVPEHIGDLTVDIFQAGTKDLIWRGRATSVLSSKPEKNEKKMDDAVESMFKHFPPASKG